MASAAPETRCLSSARIRSEFAILLLGDENKAKSFLWDDEDIKILKNLANADIADLLKCRSGLVVWRLYKWMNIHDIHAVRT